MKVWIHPQPLARVMVSDPAPTAGNVCGDQIQGVQNGDQQIQGVQESFVLSTLAASTKH